MRFPFLKPIFAQTILASCRRHRGLVVVIAAALLAEIVLFHGDLARLIGPAGDSFESTSIRVSDGEEALSSAATVSGNLVFKKDVACITPGGSATITLSCRRPRDAKVSLALRMFSDPSLSNQMELRPSGGEHAFMSNQTYSGSPPIDLTEILGDAQQYQLVFSGAVRDDAPVERPFFESVEVTAVVPASLPPLAMLWGCLLTAVACYWVARQIGAGDWISAVAAALLFAICLGLSALYEEALWPSIAGLTAVAIVGVFVIRRDPQRVDWTWARYLILGVILMIALANRGVAFDAAQGRQLDPDAQGYYGLAQDMNSPYDSGWRTPGFLWALRVFFALTHTSEYHYRLLTFLLSVAVVILTSVIGKQWFSPAVGLAAALVVACGEGLVETSTRGLRTELYTLAVGTFLILAWARGGRPGWLGATFIGLAAGLMNLIVLSSLSFTIAILAVLAIVRRWNVMHTFLALIIAAAMIAPHLRHNKDQHDDPMFTVNYHAKFYRNMEFAGRPGYPSVDEVRKDSYAGPRITPLDYIFRHHSPAVVAKAFLAGWRQMIFGRFARDFLGISGVSFAFLILGLVAAVYSASGRWTILFFLLMTAPMAFLIGRDKFSDLWRLAAHCAPWLACFVGLGIVRIAKWIPAVDGSIKKISPDA